MICYFKPGLTKVSPCAVIKMFVISALTVIGCGSKLNCFDNTFIVYICPVGIPTKVKYPKLLVNVVWITPVPSLIVTTLLETPIPDEVTT